MRWGGQKRGKREWIFFPHSVVVVRAPTDVFPLSAWEIAHSVEYLFLASPTVLLLFQLNEIIHIH